MNSGIPNTNTNHYLDEDEEASLLVKTTENTSHATKNKSHASLLIQKH